MSENKKNNFAVAIYIADKFGFNVCDEKIKEVAKALGFKPNVLLKNYKNISFIKKLKNLQDEKRNRNNNKRTFKVF